VPGAESAPNLAPQPLDHFKRGYRERAHLRDRETTTLNGDFRRHSSTDAGPPNNNRSSYNEGRGGGGGDRAYNGGGGERYDRRPSANDRGGDDRGRGQVIMGLDVQTLVDKLCRPGVDVFQELDATRNENSMIFQSGKAVTAIISNLARRRKLKLALTVWDWIDAVGIEKNTFHYNSMISVCEKVRDYHKALDLLDEMKRKNVTKNEVT
jgi:pentatricopeptide repeat protein